MDTTFVDKTEHRAPTMTTLELPNGVKIDGRTRLCTDWLGMRSLYESGMSVRDIADAYKVSLTSVKQQARKEGWVSVTKINKLRREIEAKQKDIWRKSGKATDVAAVKAAIWEDRAEEMKERTFEIIRDALEGVTPDAAKHMIRNPKGLLEIVTAAQKITGEEAKAAADTGPRLAVSIGLLRSGMVVDAPTVEAELTPDSI